MRSPRPRQGTEQLQDGSNRISFIFFQLNFGFLVLCRRQFESIYWNCSKAAWGGRFHFGPARTLRLLYIRGNVCWKILLVVIRLHWVPHISKGCNVIRYLVLDSSFIAVFETGGGHFGKGSTGIRSQQRKRIIRLLDLYFLVTWQGWNMS